MTDPRCHRGNHHHPIEMIFIALTASICGADGWVDVERRPMREEDVADAVAKSGSFDRAGDQSPLHLVTAFATNLRVCLRQMSVDGKSNEIPAVRELLELMELSGATVTADAMHCQV